MYCSFVLECYQSQYLVLQFLDNSPKPEAILFLTFDLKRFF